MTDNDYAELEAWRPAFRLIGDGTPEGVAHAINERSPSCADQGARQLGARCPFWRAPRCSKQRLQVDAK